MGIGKRIDISATPAFYVDGQRIDWSEETGGSLQVGIEDLTWDHALSGSEFVDLLLKIVKAATVD